MWVTQKTYDAISQYYKDGRNVTEQLINENKFCFEIMICK